METLLFIIIELLIAFIIALILDNFTKKHKKNITKTPKYKNCPYCNMRIPYKAIKCPYCQSDINNFN